MKENTLPIIAILYAITLSVIITFMQTESIKTFHFYLTALVSFWATCRVIKFVIKVHDSGIRLYTALGICCLTLGNLYFMLLNIVAVEPDVLSVGLFAKVCCYLFFISALTGLRAITQKNKKLVIAVNTISVIATIICAYSVITNNIAVINISVLLLDILCITLACGLVSDKRFRFFAVMMLIIVSFDILSLVVVLSVFISLLSPALYILLSQAVITLKAGEQYAE